MHRQEAALSRQENDTSSTVRACVVCGGGPTVKSHLIPRAIFHDMKRPDNPFIGNRRDGTGYVDLQSGFLDRSLLCAAHEAMLGTADKYGVELCRSFLQQVAAGADYPRVANPKPELLVDFAKACVWRSAASRTAGVPSKWLGPYARRIEDSIFGTTVFRPLLLVSRLAYVNGNGEKLNMGAPPHRYQEEGINFWRFIAGGLIFDLKLDNRSAPPAMRTLDAINIEEFLLEEDFPRSALHAPGIGTSMIRMALRPLRNRPAR